MRVRWHPSARDEADLAAAFYQRQREGLGRRFLDSLDDAEDISLRTARHLPNAGARRSQNAGSRPL
jgi:hypothetical protein